MSLTSTKSSVLLFTVSAVPQVQAVSGVAEGTAFLQWLNSGTRVVGYSWSDHAYEILGLDGGSADRIYTFFAPQPAQDAHRRAEWAQALPGGKTILLQSDDGPPRIYDVASGAFHPFLGPLGQNVVFTGTTDGVQLIFNNIVDGRSKVMTSDLNGGNARVLAENQPGSVGMIDEHASSPDGNYLLLSSSDTAGGETQWKDIVTSKSGDRVWQIAIPGIADGVETDVRWAGSNRLLVTQSRSTPGYVDVTVKFVSIPSGSELPAPPPLGNLLRRLVSLSPDGQHAIMRLGDRPAAWKQRCALVSIDPDNGSIVELAAADPGPGDYQTVFCASVDWTPDGSQAIVSAGGI